MIPSVDDVAAEIKTARKYLKGMHGGPVDLDVVVTGAGEWELRVNRVGMLLNRDITCSTAVWTVCLSHDDPHDLAVKLLNSMEPL